MHMYSRVLRYTQLFGAYVQPSTVYLSAATPPETIFDIGRNSFLYDMRFLFMQVHSYISLQ
jgi:hypothetical protein